MKSIIAKLREIMAEATEELRRAGFAVSRTWLGVRIAEEDRAAIGEYELRGEVAR